MLHPSYTDLINVVNDRSLEDEVKVRSRYSVVIATAKRARQLIDGEMTLTKTVSPKPLSNAVNELYEGKIDIV
ncbi:DNA-directed RNA polymerase subunit omega [Anaerotalea alkaliphila]|uniref:DNA-directed RNA polymerase subunit omega n=1 Tax=Anaerotalea alkaliphila TaxID=2662126 RepID=A0A7X5HUJ4_9FIRM|nr:DNA-directed RNA polymerase subunit omega [Anaerotalea alkaliphila]NDL66894.1 DNA-directed RNA polymerase subunit omega [Anaerotalea alkaliphila]